MSFAKNGRNFNLRTKIDTPFQPTFKQNEGMIDFIGKRKKRLRKSHKMNEARVKKDRRLKYDQEGHLLPSSFGSPLPLFYTLVSGCPKVNV